MSYAQLKEVEQSTNVPEQHESKLDEILNGMAKENQNERASRKKQPKHRLLKAACSGDDQDENDLDAQDIRCVPKCKIVNYTKEDITHKSEKDFSGTVLGAYPVKIVPRAVCGFRHGDVDDAAGAVLYQGTINQTPCAWILAWKATSTEKKVYVEAGPATKYEKEECWGYIEQKLNSATNKAHYKHHKTGAEVSAKVGNDPDFIAAAVFDVTNIRD